MVPSMYKGKVEKQQQHITRVHTGHNTPENLRMLRDEEGPWLDSVCEKGRCQNSHCSARRDAQGKQRNEASSHSRIIRRLGSGHPLDDALAKHLRSPGDTPFQRIGQERRNDCAHAWQNTHEKSDEASPDNCRAGILPVLACEPKARDAPFEHFHPLALIQIQENLGDAEQTDDQRREANPVEQSESPKIEAGGGVHRVQTDRGQEEPQ